MKKSLSRYIPILLVAAGLVALPSCKKDEFTEEDVLKLTQNTSYSVYVKEAYTDSGVSGAAVTLTQDGQTFTQQTNEQGIAHFEKVKIGQALLHIQRDKFLAVDKEIKIGTYEYYYEDESGNYTYGEKVNDREGNRGMTVNFYSLNGDPRYSAVIRGKVTIQTDLTTAAEEVPTGLVVKAILVETKYNPYDSNSWGGNYYPYDGYNDDYYTPVVMSAPVDAEGKFSFNIPVGMDGRYVRLKFPTLTYTQKMQETVSSSAASNSAEVVTVSKLASFDPYKSASTYDVVGTNISSKGPSGFTWPNGVAFQKYVGSTLYYTGYDAYNYGYSYYLQRGSVLDLRLDYGTGTIRD